MEHHLLETPRKPTACHVKFRHWAIGIRTSIGRLVTNAVKARRWITKGWKGGAGGGNARGQREDVASSALTNAAVFPLLCMTFPLYEPGWPQVSPTSMTLHAHNRFNSRIPGQIFRQTLSRTVRVEAAFCLRWRSASHRRQPECATNFFLLPLLLFYGTDKHARSNS